MLIYKTTTLAVIWKQYKISLWNFLLWIPFLHQLPDYLRMTHISRTEPCPQKPKRSFLLRKSLCWVAGLSHVKFGHGQWVFSATWTGKAEEVAHLREEGKNEVYTDIRHTSWHLHLSSRGPQSPATCLYLATMRFPDILYTKILFLLQLI